MIRFLALLLCLVGLALPASAQLPDDARNLLLIVVTNDAPSPADVRVLSQLDGDPHVAPIAAACHVHRFRPRDQLYQLRYAQSLPPNNLPIVALARPDGGVIYKTSGRLVPTDGEELATQLTTAAREDAAMRPPSSGIPDTRNSFGPVASDPAGLSMPMPNLPLIPDTIDIKPRFEISWPVMIAAAFVAVVVIGCAMLGLLLVLVLVFKR